MIWGFLTVIVVGLVLLFAAPFLDFLTPDSTIWLVCVFRRFRTPAPV